MKRYQQESIAITGLWVGLSVRKNWHEIYHVLEDWFPAFVDCTANPVRIMSVINTPAIPCWQIDDSLKKLDVWHFNFSEWSADYLTLLQSAKISTTQCVAKLVLNC